MNHGPKHCADLLARHGLAPDKSLGQNFLVDPNQVDRIVRLAGVGPGDHVVEVGPGLGALTAGLLDAGAYVTAVEVDSGLVQVLRSEFSNDNLTVVHHDALTVDWATTLAGADEWKMVANLPYNIATPLVLDVLDHVPAVTRLLVMVQREVGLRLVAPPGSADYGIPSVKTAYWAHGSVVARVPASVFLPQPRVESALVRLDRHLNPPCAEPVGAVFELVKTAFGQRRKMVRKTLGGLLDAEAFAAAGVDPQARPETLGIADWCSLARARREGTKR